MSKREKVKILIWVLIFLTLFLVLFLLTLTPNEITSPPTVAIHREIGINQPVEKPKGKTESAVIVKVDINKLIYESKTGEEVSVYDFMNKLKKEGKIEFTEKTYTGMGKFIDSINGVSGNGRKNWIYYVNSEEAEVGISNYKLINGDIVSWKYE